MNLQRKLKMKPIALLRAAPRFRRRPYDVRLRIFLLCLVLMYSAATTGLDEQPSPFSETTIHRVNHRIMLLALHRHSYACASLNLTRRQRNAYNRSILAARRGVLYTFANLCTFAAVIGLLSVMSHGPFMALLLLLCGDVELNPGPRTARMLLSIIVLCCKAIISYFAMQEIVVASSHVATWCACALKRRSSISTARLHDLNNTARICCWRRFWFYCKIVISHYSGLKLGPRLFITSTRSNG